VDEFEGMQYQRVQVMIQLESGEQKSAWVYEMLVFKVSCFEVF